MCTQNQIHNDIHLKHVTNREEYINCKLNIPDQYLKYVKYVKYTEPIAIRKRS